jgi:hypothetical protein
VNGYRGKHRKHADPEELAEVSSGLAGLADWIVIVDSKPSSEE